MQPSQSAIAVVKQRGREISLSQSKSDGNLRHRFSIDITEENSVGEDLKRGATFIKHGARGSPHERHIHCSPDLKYVQWGRKKDQQLPVAHLSQVIMGRHTAVFARDKEKDVDAAHTHARESRCFSLIFTERTLDLETSTVGEKDMWLRRFHWLMENHSQRAVSMPYNVKHVAHVDTEYNWSGDTIEDDFELVEELGSGAFGEVYRARQKGSTFDVAIKIIEVDDKNKIDEIKREVEILKKLRHKNIVEFYGCYGPDSQNNLWIMMQFCDGGSVLDLINPPIDDDSSSSESESESDSESEDSEAEREKAAKKAKKKQAKAAKPAKPPKNELVVTDEELGTFLTEDQIRYICAQTLLAIDYMHNKRAIIHRDIKSGNILLTKDGGVRLTDFGISRVMEDSNNKKQAKLAGSPVYMSPEMIRDKGATADYKADIWALGITMIEMAEGEPPLAHMHPFKILQEITKNPPPRLSDENIWSKDFVDFIAQCLTKDPSKRPTAIDLMTHPWIMPAFTMSPSIIMAIFDKNATTKEGKTKPKTKAELEAAEKTLRRRKELRTTMILAERRRQREFEEKKQRAAGGGGKDAAGGGAEMSVSNNKRNSVSVPGEEKHDAPETATTPSKQAPPASKPAPAAAAAAADKKKKTKKDDDDDGSGSSSESDSESGSGSSTGSSTDEDDEEKKKPAEEDRKEDEEKKPLSLAERMAKRGIAVALPGVKQETDADAAARAAAIARGRAKREAEEAAACEAVEKAQREKEEQERKERESEEEETRAKEKEWALREAKNKEKEEAELKKKQQREAEAKELAEAAARAKKKQEEEAAERLANEQRAKREAAEKEERERVEKERVEREQKEKAERELREQKEQEVRERAAAAAAVAAAAAAKAKAQADEARGGGHDDDAYMDAGDGGAEAVGVAGEAKEVQIWVQLAGLDPSNAQELSIPASSSVSLLIQAVARAHLLPAVTEPYHVHHVEFRGRTLKPREELASLADSFTRQDTLWVHKAVASDVSSMASPRAYEDAGPTAEVKTVAPEVKVAATVGSTAAAQGTTATTTTTVEVLATEEVDDLDIDLDVDPAAHPAPTQPVPRQQGAAAAAAAASTDPAAVPPRRPKAEQTAASLEKERCTCYGTQCAIM